MQKLFSFFIALFIGLSSIAQVNLDSLWNVWNDKTHADSSRLKAMQKIAWNGYLFSQPDSAFYFAQLMYDFALLNNNEKAICGALNIKGVSLVLRGYDEKALTVFKQNIKIQKQIGDKNGIASSNNNIGLIYMGQRNHKMAITHYQKSLKIFEEIKDEKGKSKCLSNIATIYNDIGDYEKAIIYNEKSLEIDEKIGYKKGMRGNFNNLGNIYRKQRDYEKAIKYYTKSKIIFEDIGDKRGVAGSLNNIGTIYYNQGKLNTALTYFTNSLNIRKEIGIKNGIASSLNCIGNVKYEQGYVFESITFHQKSLKIASVVNALDLVKLNSESLYDSYKKLGKYKQALEMHELYMETKDSIAKMDAEEELYKFEVDKEYELRKQADSIKHADEILIQQAENLAKEEQLKNEKQRRTGLLIIVGLVLLSLGFVFVQLKNTRAQKLIIEKQHLNLNQSHKEITDSINYAKRIQDALMTSQVYMKDVIPQSFIFFQPKDVVSGDFYWVYRSPTGEIYFTVVDCTGHGVPGAFMSMIGCSLLNEMIIENNVEDTNLILDQISDKLKVSLEYQGKKSQPRDGMDMVLCRLNEQKNELMFTGAKNSLVLIRDGKVLEYKGDKRPVGYYLGKGIKFTAQKIEVQKNDMIYLFSDGFVDQFGGERNKKYMSSKFKRFLLEISDMPTKQQEYLVKVEFTDWIGDNEQIDDVCVMGVRI